MRTVQLLAATFLCSLTLLFSITTTQAQIPRIISYQGIAFADNKTPVADGDHTFALSLYTTESGGTPIYTQSGSARTVDGLFTILIGPLPSSLSFNASYWFGISVDGAAELTPRTRLTASPYALNASRSDSALYAGRLVENAPGVVTSVNGRSGAITLQGTGGTTLSLNGNAVVIHSDVSTGSGTGWLLDGNAGTTSGEDFIGTQDDQPFEIHVDHSGGFLEATSGRGRVMLFEPNGTSPNVITGFQGNSRSERVLGATVAGGGAFAAENVITGNYGSVGGGKGNKASENGTVGGGISNSALGQSSTVAGGSSNVVESTASTIGGGLRNRAKDWNSTIGGGKENMAESLSSTIAGGESNAATGIGSAIGGGIGNLVFGNYGMVGGGESNATSREHSTVGGGRYNNASADGSTVAGGVSDTASGNYAFTGGGIGNRSKGLHSSVVGGEVNHADGRASTIAGGSVNVAEGDYSAIIGGQGLTLKGARSFGFLANTPAVNKSMSISASNVAVLGNVDLWLANNDSAARQIRFYAPNPTSGAFPGLSANYSSFQAGDQTTNIEYILPRVAGSVGDQLGISNVNGSKVTLTWLGITSDRALKENFLAIDGESLLTKFRTLDLGSWNYRGESHRHYGVMAQDFNAAFGKDELGAIGSDTTVQIVDLAGVAYIAIQALEQRTNELQQTQATLLQTVEELKRARREQEELRARIEKLEEKIR